MSRVLPSRRRAGQVGAWPSRSRSAATTPLAALKLSSRHSAGTDPVFAAKNGNPLGHRNVTRRGFDPAANRAGITCVSFHDMRHAFASRMIGASPRPSSRS